MLYLRADATKGYSGGYHYDTRGMLKTGGGPKSQFYLIDIGSCWKNNGARCDGDVLTDVTRYSEMIVNPETPAWCSSTNIGNCPPYHITPNNTKILRNDTAHFPYGAYHYYCAPGNAQHLEKPYSTCDPYSNPQAQELLQLLPHPIWGSTATLPSREMVGSEMAEPGSSTLEAFPVDFISTRIQVALRQEEYGPLLTWEQKFLSVIRTKWLNGLSVTSMSF
ncbi:UNVERIFIED_CONTAM: hypothetical protein Sradi_1307700 [Sesamum radiatum]|uniref:DUF7705 domain-containing protein n=1 Tax=Sesamum radiatum TaxID=300843 RepID=A0AAW2UQ82_SESRA